MNQAIPINQHDIEIQKNLQIWNHKPLLRKIYLNFHKLIASYTLPAGRGLTVELGSGIGNIKEVIPDCIRTDLFQNPWIDQTESAYSLSFSDNSVANLILFDVFHHLRYPGNALQEFHRVLVKNGRIVIFEPCMSVLGLLIYGLFHHEPIAIFDKINWKSPSDWNPEADTYYAAQGNASRIFFNLKYRKNIADWVVIKTLKLSAISYVSSGGYSKRQLYPDSMYNLMRKADSLFDLFPLFFATRLLVVMEKK